MLYPVHIEPLALEVADDATGTYKQKVHQIDTFVPIGPVGLIRLDVYLTAYGRNPDGSYGDPLPTDRVPVRKVTLTAVPTCAVEPSGKVRYRLLVPGLVRDVVAGQDITLAEEQTFEQFAEALPDLLVLQHLAMAEKRDNEQLNVRAFAEQQVRAADLPPSSFA